MTFSLTLLGQFRLLSPDGESIEISSRKHQVLVAVLTLAGGQPVARATLATLLWGEQTETQARNSLRQALFVILQATGKSAEPPFFIERQSCSIRAGALSSDTDMLLNSTPSDNLVASLVDRGGEFLDGLSFDEEGLQAWITAQRHRLRENLVHHLFQSASELERSGDGDGAISTAQALLRHDPYHEPAHRILLRTYQARGERLRARKHYGSLQALLREDFGVLPEAETQLLAERLLVDESAGSPVAALKPRLGVLPAVDLDDSEDQTIADLLTRKLTGELARFSPISVIAAPTMLALQRRHLTVEEIGRRVRADYLLDLAFQGKGENSWTLAQLISVKGGISIWSRTFQGETPHSVVAEDRLVRLVSGDLYQFLMRHAAGIASREEAERAQGETLYLKAFYHVERPTEGGMVEARDLCERLLGADPRHVLVRESLAWVNFHSCFNGWLEDPLEGFYEARDVAAAGLRLDDREPYLLSALGLAEAYLGNGRGGLLSLQKAVELNPSNAEFHTWRGIGLTVLSRVEEAHAAFDEAQQLSPDYPPVLLFRGDAHLVSGDYEPAIACLDRFLIALPEYHWARLLRAAAALSLGRRPDAHADALHVRVRSPRLAGPYVARLLYARSPAYSALLQTVLELKAG